MVCGQRLGSRHSAEKSSWTVIPILSPIGPVDRRAPFSLDARHPCCPLPPGTLTPFLGCRSSSPRTSNSESGGESMGLFHFSPCSH